MFGRLGFLLTVVAVAVHLVALVGRGMAADPNRVPWGNMYEFTLTGTFGVALIYLLLLRPLAARVDGAVRDRVPGRRAHARVIWPPSRPRPLHRALHSYWLVIHVGAAILATGAFTLGGIASLALPAQGAPRRGAARPGCSARVPAARRLDRLVLPAARVRLPAVDLRGAHRRADLGPPGLVRPTGTGTPRRCGRSSPGWSTPAYLHARATAGWKGRAAAILALVGFATLRFNFVGINFFFGQGSHALLRRSLTCAPLTRPRSGESLRPLAVEVAQEVLVVVRAPRAGRRLVAGARDAGPGPRLRRSMARATR